MTQEQVNLLINSAEWWVPEEPVWLLSIHPNQWDLMKDVYHELFDIQSDENDV